MQASTAGSSLAEVGQGSRGRAGEGSRGKAGCGDRAGQQPLGHDRSAGAGQGRAGPQRHDRAGGSHG